VSPPLAPLIPAGGASPFRFPLYTEGKIRQEFEINIFGFENVMISYFENLLFSMK
jgi:hypothetical protein